MWEGTKHAEVQAEMPSDVVEVHHPAYVGAGARSAEDHAKEAVAIAEVVDTVAAEALGIVAVEGLGIVEGVDDILEEEGYFG